MSDPLRTLTQRLGHSYRLWKQAEKFKDEDREEFFKLATEQSKESLAEKVVDISYAKSEEDARQQISKAWPRWNIEDVRTNGDGRYEAIIRENPAFKKFSYTNPDDGMIYERQVSVGAPELDDERLMAENPDLYDRVTYVPEPERQLKDFQDISEEDLAELADYIHEGKATVKFAAPRQAREE